LLDSFEDKEGRLNLVLEYAAGGTLSSWVDSNLSGIAPRVAIRIMRQLAHGLMQIHGQRVTHGDISGKNLLLMGNPLTWDSESPLVKYADFGSSVFRPAFVGRVAQKDVDDTFGLIQRVAEKAFADYSEQSEYIVMQDEMTAKGLLTMVELLGNHLIENWRME
jgi:serine/threonine protein kinase